jgi:hypothetical protein
MTTIKHSTPVLTVAYTDFQVPDDFVAAAHTRWRSSIEQMLQSSSKSSGNFPYTTASGRMARHVRAQRKASPPHATPPARRRALPLPRRRALTSPLRRCRVPPRPDTTPPRSGCRAPPRPFTAPPRSDVAPRAAPRAATRVRVPEPPHRRPTSTASSRRRPPRPPPSSFSRSVALSLRPPPDPPLSRAPAIQP